MTAVLGVVPISARDQLVLAQLRGRSLLAYAVKSALEVTDDVVIVSSGAVAGLDNALASDGLTRISVRRLDTATGTELLAADCARASHVVVHDPKCPLLPATEIARVLIAAATAAVGVRPVTDTVKTLAARPSGPRVSATLDRNDYRAVCSPLALSAGSIAILAAEVGAQWWTTPLWRLVETLRHHVGVELVGVSSLARRVEDEDAIWLLECFDDVRRMVRET